MVAHVHDAAAFCEAATGRRTVVLFTDDTATSAPAAPPDALKADTGSARVLLQQQQYHDWFPVVYGATPA